MFASQESKRQRRRRIKGEYKERKWARKQFLKKDKVYLIHKRNIVYFIKLGFKYEGLDSIGQVVSIVCDKCYKPGTYTATRIELP